MIESEVFRSLPFDQQHEQRVAGRAPRDSNPHIAGFKRRTLAAAEGPDFLP